MIVVEGPDGSGKTTLIKALGYTSRHLKSLRGSLGGTTKEGWAAPCETTLMAYRRMVAGARRAETRPVQEPPGPEQIAFDRFHLSEHVYGPLLRGRQDVSEDTLITVGRMLHEQKVPLILCLPSFEETLINVQEQGRERPSYQTEEFLAQAYEGFRRLAMCATVVYDYTIDAVPTISQGHVLIPPAPALNAD